MSDFENKQNSSGDDSDRRPHALYSERQWRAILRRSEAEAARFLKIYEETLPLQSSELETDDRLDHCALKMGWLLKSAPEEKQTELQPEGESIAVYSLHNLPISIVVFALCDFARTRWERLWKTPYAGKLSAKTVFELSETFFTAQRDLLLAIDASDASDLGLAMCLSKDVLASLNKHLACMESLPIATQDAAYTQTVKELRHAVWDLRDTCLRIHRDAYSDLKGSVR